MTTAKWVDTILPRLPGVPKALVEDEVVRVINDFCYRSTLVREMVRGLDIITGEREVLVPSDDPTLNVIGVLRVYLNGMRLTDFSHVPWEVEAAYPHGYAVRVGPPLKLELSAIPNVDNLGELDVFTYCAPVDPAAATPAILDNMYFETIMYGVTGNLMSFPGRPYSDQQAAVGYMRNYRAGLSRARAEAAAGHTANAANWTFPTYGV